MAAGGCAHNGSEASPAGAPMKDKLVEEFLGFLEVEAQRFAAHPANLSRRAARFSCADQRARLAPVQGAALSRLPLRPDEAETGALLHPAAVLRPCAASIASSSRGIA